MPWRFDIEVNRSTTYSVGLPSNVSRRLPDTLVRFDLSKGVNYRRQGVVKVLTRKRPVWWGPRGIIGLRHVVIRPSNSGTQLWVVKSSMRTLFVWTKWPEFWHMTFSSVFQKVSFVFRFRVHGRFLQWVQWKKFSFGLRQRLDAEHRQNNYPAQWRSLQVPMSYLCCSRGSESSGPIYTILSSFKIPLNIINKSDLYIYILHLCIYKSDFTWSSYKLSLITCKLTISSTVFFSGYHQGTIKTPCHWSFVRGIHRWPVVPITKGQ